MTALIDLIDAIGLPAGGYGDIAAVALTRSIDRDHLRTAVPAFSASSVPCIHLFGVRLDDGFDLLRCFCRALGQRAHFGGPPRQSPALLTGAVASTAAFSARMLV